MLLLHASLYYDNIDNIDNTTCLLAFWQQYALSRRWWDRKFYEIASVIKTMINISYAYTQIRREAYKPKIQWRYFKSYVNVGFVSTEA